VVPLRVLTWNLKHGRSVPPAGRELFGEFAEALAGWDWEIALLQEVPPWWPALLGSRLGAGSARVLTSRNFGLAVRQAIAVRWPDAIKSNGGGSNAVLVRGLDLVERRALRLTPVPERRWLLGVRVWGPGSATGGVWVGNIHASGWPPRAAAREARRAARALTSWATAGEPIILGGDFNFEWVSLDGFAWAGGAEVDHVFARGLDRLAEPEVLDQGSLSDHPPVLVRLGSPVRHGDRDFPGARPRPYAN